MNIPFFFKEKIKIFNGDNIQTLKKLNLDLEKVIFVSDPPYNIGYHYNEYKDKKPELVYYNWLNDIFKKKAHVLIHYPEYLYKYSILSNQIPNKVISWVYNSNTGKQHRDIAFYNVKPDLKKVGQDYKNPTDKRIAKRIAEGKKAKLYDWWQINQVKNVSTQKTAHPCQMPIKVMENIIGILPENYTIIDPFLGSGTTAIACIKYDRKFIGIELNRDYYEIAKNRIIENLKTI